LVATGISNRRSTEIDPELEKYYLPKDSPRVSSSRNNNPNVRSSNQQPSSSDELIRTDNRPGWLRNFPKINLRCDPLINFKLKQRLILLGACVTLGMDYLTDIAQWRSYCSIEDTWLHGRFSLRGSELGWAKAWILNLGLGEENSAKLKLRLGLNTKTQRLSLKLRFRTEPLSPFDIGDGISCAGKLPLPLYLFPAISRSLPLRVEYRLRINTNKGQQPSHRLSSNQGNPNEQRVVLSTGLGAVDVSLDELNFCVEFDEHSPVWDIGLVRSDPLRKRIMQQMRGPSSSSSSSGVGGSMPRQRPQPQQPTGRRPGGGSKSNGGGGGMRRPQDYF